jgi:hypothetical protein
MSDIETPEIPETGDEDDSLREVGPQPEPDMQPGEGTHAPKRLSRRQFIPRAIGGLAAALGVGGVAGYELRHPHTGGAAAAEPAGPTATEIPTAGNPGSGVGSFVTRPTLRPALVRVTNLTDRSTSSMSPGFIAMAPMPDVTYKSVQRGPMLIDRSGRLVWFDPQPKSTFDVKVQSYQGEPVITYWYGDLVGGHGVGVGKIVDRTYRTIAVVGNEQRRPIDLHEFNLTSRGTALATYWDSRTYDLSPIGGPKSGVLLVGHALEIDIATGRTLLDWVSVDHVGIEESYQPSPSGSDIYDYFHINSIAEAADGNLLVSARNTWAVYKVNRQTGEVMWRLNGKRSDFRLDKGAEFSWQHHVRAHGTSELTVFNNAATSDHGSLGLLLDLDETSKRARLKQAYQHPAKFLAWTLGSIQVRPDGNVFIGWGSQPYFSEFSASGELLVDGQFESWTRSYRTFLGEWHGKPRDKPVMLARTEPENLNSFVVYASWNGATEIDHWTVLAGSDAASLQPIASQAWSGFETTIAVGSEGPVFAVAAIDRDGNELGRSDPT